MSSSSLGSKNPEIERISEIRTKHPHNPLLGYLNINSLRNKVIDLCEYLSSISLDYFVLSETKLNSEFPSAQFDIEGYEVRARRDRNQHGGGLIEYVRKGIICKRLTQLETEHSECICSEITVSKKKWIVLSIYRPPSVSNIDLFFDEITISLNKALSISENIIVMGDFNIDIMNHKDPGFSKLEVLCDTFDLSNLIRESTCITKTHKSTIDLILTNKPLSFHLSSTCETGISDHHRLILTFMGAHIVRLKPKVITYRNYKNFNKESFLNDLNERTFNFNKLDANQSYESLTKHFLEVVNKHAPLKQRTVRDNHAPFMDRHFQKQIYIRSHLKNSFLENKQDKIGCYTTKRQRNKCVKLRRKCIKKYFSKITTNGVVTNRKFWTTIRPFLTSKGCLQNNEIMINENDSIISDEKELTELFNNFYINIVEKTSGIKPSSVVENGELKTNSEIVNEIIDAFRDHSKY